MPKIKVSSLGFLLILVTALISRAGYSNIRANFVGA